MTVILAMENRYKAIMACDSRITIGNLHTTTHPDDCKLVTIGEMVIGGTGCVADSQLLRFHLTPPPIATDDYRTVVNTVEAMREMMKAHDRVSIERPAYIYTEFLIGYRGRIYEVSSDFTVQRMNRPFAAIGSGGQIAIGYMEAKRRSIETTPRLAGIARAALDVAGRYAVGVAAPYIVKEVGSYDAP